MTAKLNISCPTEFKKTNILLKKPAKGGTPAIEKKVITKKIPNKGFVLQR